MQMIHGDKLPYTDGSKHGKTTMNDLSAWPGEVLEKIQAAQRPLVLSGAGMSAESGIPTFRDALTGHWARYRPEELATPEAFARHPQRVWNWYEERRRAIRATRPNAGHHALAALERRWPALVIVTQNVDGFHQLAGSSSVIELHGNIQRSVCSITGEALSDEQLLDSDQKPPPSPYAREGLARPDVVWFGESLPTAALERALSLASRCDLLLAIGTSGVVQPAASLPLLARDAGALFLELNPEPTSLSPHAQRVVRSTAAVALPELVERLAA